jgi:hypothetical protein
MVINDTRFEHVENPQNISIAAPFIPIHRGAERGKGVKGLRGNRAVG